jgi:2-methylcitrate dehydratase PrpD
MSSDANPEALVDRLGQRWALLETSFKFHASCRHTHPAADALLELMQRERLAHDAIESVVARVHQSALDVLGAVQIPRTEHQAKFSMGTVLGLIAVFGRAGLDEFRDHALSDPRVHAFRQRVTMVLDSEVERAYPKRWLGRVDVTTRSGQILHGAIDDPKGDPGNPLSRAELEDKLRRLVRFSGSATAAEAQGLIARIWRLRDLPRVGALLAAHV